MTLEDIISVYNLRSQLDFAITSKRFMKLSKIKRYKYVDITDTWYYEYDQDGTHWIMNDGIVMEGIGYGDIWCNNWLRTKCKFLQRKAILNYVFDRLSEVGKSQSIITYSTQDGDNVVHYIGYMTDDKCYTEIRYSKKYFDHS